MNGCSLKEGPCIKCLLGLKLTTELKWNSYIAKNARKMVYCLYHYSKGLNPSMLWFFDWIIRKKIMYFTTRQMKHRRHSMGIRVNWEQHYSKFAFQIRRLGFFLHTTFCYCFCLDSWQSDITDREVDSYISLGN